MLDEFCMLVDDRDEPADEWFDGEGYEVVVLHEVVDARHLQAIPTDKELRDVADRYDALDEDPLWIAVYDNESGNLVKIVDPTGIGYLHLRDHLRDLKRAAGRDNLFDKMARGWRKAIRLLRSPRKTIALVLAKFDEWYDVAYWSYPNFWDLR